MDWISDPQMWVAFFTLIALELILGVDNVIFISILAGKLPVEQQTKARRTGLALALISRIALLFSLKWLIGLEEPLINIGSIHLSGHDLILIIGGFFLVGKATHEIHDKLEGSEGHASSAVKATFVGVMIQVMLLDVVFSLDSVITAVGMVDQIAIMVGAVIVAAIVMIMSADPIGNFVEGHPTVKILALSFLLLIGFTLIAEGFGQHVSKEYIYFAMAFSALVEFFNLRMKKAKRDPIALHKPYVPEEAVAAPAEHN